MTFGPPELALARPFLFREPALNLTNLLENRFIDGFFRGGAITSSGTAGSTAVCNKGIRTNNTAYSQGDVVAPNGLDTSAGGKFLECTTAGTSQTSLAALSIGNPGTTVSDGTVVWTVVSGIPSLRAQYLGFLVINKGVRANSTSYNSGDCISLIAQGGSGGDSLAHCYQCTVSGVSNPVQPQYNGVPGEVVIDGTAVFTELSPTLDSGTGFPSGLTEPSTGSYARVKVNAAVIAQLADWAGTQGPGTTTSSTGSSGTTSNNGTIAMPSPTANWAAAPAAVGYAVLCSQLTGSNYLVFAAMPVPKTVNSGDFPPTVLPGAYSSQVDN